MGHIISILVDNQPGVLLRVVSLFSRRNFNIHSLTVGTSDCPNSSRITIVVYASSPDLEQIIAQLRKLPVVKAVILLNDKPVARGLSLIKVNADSNSHSHILNIASLFRAHVVDVNLSSLILECSGSLDKLNAFANLLKPFGIIEFIQTGLIALDRGNSSIYSAPPNPTFFAKNLL